MVSISLYIFVYVSCTSKCVTFNVGSSAVIFLFVTIIIGYQITMLLVTKKVYKILSSKPTPKK